MDTMLSKEYRRLTTPCAATVAGILFALLFAASLQHIEVTGLEVETAFNDFSDYWVPFLGGQGPAPGYIAGLDVSNRAALEEHLRA